MKTIKYLAASLALMLAWQAQAVTYWTLLVTDGASSEVNGYSAYYCTKTQAATFFGEGNDTYDKVAAYLTESKENYDKGMKALTDGGVALAQYEQSGSQLAFYKYLESALSGEFIAVVAFSSASADANDQVRVFGATANGSGQLAFDPASGQGSATQGWATVPEPTSGMLLLLGVAGLALKRKRA